MAVPSKPACKYGSKCYRKNPQHLKQYTHPTIDSNQDSNTEDNNERKRVREEEETENNDSISKRLPTMISSENSNLAGSKLEDNKLIKEKKEETFDQPVVIEREKEDLELSKGQDCDVEEEKDCDDIKENVKRKFLVQMPDDFYHFWDFCKSLSPENPLVALSSTLQLSLVGPYHMLAGKLSNKKWSQCVLHYRYYYDPPELVTVLAREEEGEEKSGFHIGYFRDDPSNIKECFMVTNTSSEGCTLTHTGLNIFAAVRNEITKKLKNKKLSQSLKEDLKSLESSLLSKGEELGLNMKDLKPSKRKVVTKCFNGVGISVPVNIQLDIGYRPLNMSNKELQRLLDKIVSCTDDTKHDQISESLHEMITCVQFANDESDYGMGLELGIDLWCHGSNQFHDHILRILPLAYQLLGRDVYSRIVQEHVKNRQYVPLDVTQ